MLKKINIPPAVMAGIVFLLCLLIGLGIKTLFPSPNNVTRSVYYWKNNFYLDTNDSITLKKLGISKIYFKLMDIDWSPVHHAYPVSKAEIQIGFNLRQELVPVIFITNRTMLNIEKEAIPDLANKIWKKVYNSLDSYYHIYEIQLDCDWTEKSKENYFYLISELKKISNRKISATIRLWQYKYPTKAGVPPADRGMLMCYNMDDYKKMETENSIFTKETALSYINGVKKYPLELDIALPAYSWSVLFHLGKFATIIDELDEEEIQQLSYLVPQGDNKYMVSVDTVLTRPQSFENIYLRAGDILRLENITPDDFIQSAKIAREAINSKNISVSFFSYDTATINKFGSKTYEKVYHTFSR